ncbi:MAG: ribosome biogenesis GTP-binding protein YihA/YsxC [Bacteroidota bacterium]
MSVIQIAKYKGSYPSIEICPKADRPEYAFIGRSNVGKSSLTNMICDKRNMAHTSKKPGKTQMINYFDIDDKWYLVDLPGYGYAKISKKQRLKWRRMIETYLKGRESLCCIFLLVDSNVPPQNIDIEFMNWLGQNHIPFVIVYTKTDRLKPEELEANLTAIRKKLLDYWEALPEQFLTSSNERTGRENILQFIASINQQTNTQ